MHFLNGLLFVAVALGSFTQQSSGSEWNKKSTLMVEESVEFPGTVLEPGVYIIRLREGNEHRSVVEILNEDETQLLTTVVAVPDHRQRPDDSTEFTFHSINGDRPRPVQTWYFPGDLVGLEFVYPKNRAKEIAQDTDSHVMASNDIKGGVIVAITPNGKEVVIDSQVTETARRKVQ